MVSLGQKLKMPQTAPNDSTRPLELFCAKNARKNTKYSRNETILKIGHIAKAIAFAKCSVWVKNKKCQIHAKNDCTRAFELFFAKIPFKRTLEL